MKSIIKLIGMISFLAFANVMIAQDNNAQSDVVVYLKSGTVMTAKLIHWEVGEYYNLLIQNGQTIKINESEVKKLVDTAAQKAIKLAKPYNFAEQGYYYQFRMQLIGTNGGIRGDGVPGGGLSLVAGKQWSRWLGTGIGIGYDKYFFDTGEDIVPVFADFIGYFASANTSPFYHLSVGYGVARKDTDFGIVNADGGLYLHPSLGVRWGDKKLKWLLEVGYKFQNATFEYGSEFDTRNRNIYDIQYQRLTVGLVLHY